jgi:hypothetical protein
MKITIESTPELAHANGLPVRVWTGATERGTSLLVLVTRIAAPDDGHPDDLAELKATLTEPPTRHGVYGETPVVAEPRWCNACRARHSLKKPALFVARDAEGLEWFECSDHDPTDNLAETVRVVLEPIADWFDRLELPLPGGVYSGPASQRQPWASMLRKRLENRESTAVELHEACDLLLAQYLLDNPGALPSKTSVLDLMHWSNMRLVKSGELEHLVERMRKPSREPGVPWLVKDFHALYLAADHASVALLEVPRAAEVRTTLMMDLARLRPAFDVCEGERHGAPDRLTVAEREALTALHRWLHSPGGDWELIEAAQPYHDQVEGESPSDCERLDAEETRAYAGVHIPSPFPINAAAHAALDSLGRVSEALVICDGLEPQLEDPFHCAVRAIRAALVGAPLPTVVEPPLPHDVIAAIVDDDRAGEQQTGSAFVRLAMRGALLGWHAKHAHPETIALAGRRGAPIDEPARSAWLTGFRLGAGLDPADDLGVDETPEAPKASTPGVCRVCKCTDDDCSQCIAKTGEPCAWVEPDLCSACDTDAAAELRARGLDLAAMNRGRLASGLPTISAVQALARLDATREVLEATAPAPIALNDELREYAREHLAYRAPELLTARDRAIRAAYDAEETARAKSPETWLGGDR